MTTVIAVYNSEGCVGRCDAKCHNAQEPVCECICNGANHGVGLKKAIENNQQKWNETLEQFENEINRQGFTRLERLQQSVMEFA